MSQLLEHRPGSRMYRLERLHRLRRQISAAVVSLPASLALACIILQPATAWASIAEERRMGEEFIVEARRRLPLVRDFEVNALVEDIGMRIVKGLGEQPFDYEFLVLRADDLNAFAVPGGKIAVHAGLLAAVESEDELAGVLGHEVAHAHAHHIVRQQRKSSGSGLATILAMFLGAVHPVLAAGALAANSAIQMRYQRDFEREADFLGVRYAREAGFRPDGILALLRKMQRAHGADASAIPPYFLTHPLTTERLTNLEAVLGSTEWDVTGVSRSLRLQRAAAVCRALSQRRHEAVPDFERRLADAGADTRGEALELIGVLMTHGQDYARAEQYLAEAASLGRHVDRELGRAYLRLGKLDKARPLLERAVGARDEDWNASADLGTLEYQEGNAGRAVELLTRSVKQHAFRSEVVRTLGRASAKAGDEALGFFWFAKASELDLNPRQALVYYRKALDGAGKGRSPVGAKDSASAAGQEGAGEPAAGVKSSGDGKPGGPAGDFADWTEEAEARIEELEDTLPPMQPGVRPGR